jgi:hypothetical protein
MTDAGFDAFLPRTVNREGRMVATATGHALPAEDLFGNLESSIACLLGSGMEDTPPGIAPSPLAAFVAAPGVAITVDRASVRPSHVQCLLATLRRGVGPQQPNAPLATRSIDATCGLTLWTNGSPDLAELAARTWCDISAIGRVEPLTASTTPWSYGNKLRLAGFIGPVIATALNEGAPLLDLMAGTGIVARTVADRHRVIVNDANPFAALLAHCQGITPQAWILPR